MKRVWFIFACIYTVVILVTGLLVGAMCITDRSLENMRWWFSFVVEVGFLVSPVVFLFSYLVALAWNFSSRTSEEDFEISETSKSVFLILGVLFFVVLPFFLMRDNMLSSAARKGKIVRAQFWLALGADANSKDGPLSWAIIYGKRDMVELLLKKNARFDTNDVLRIVPRGHEEIADVLKKHGAVETNSRSRQDAYGCTLPLDQHRNAPFDKD